MNVNLLFVILISNYSTKTNNFDVFKYLVLQLDGDEILKNTNVKSTGIFILNWPRNFHTA